MQNPYDSFSVVLRSKLRPSRRDDLRSLKLIERERCLKSWGTKSDGSGGLDDKQETRSNSSVIARMRDYPTVHCDSIEQKQEVARFSYGVRLAIRNPWQAPTLAESSFSFTREFPTP
ncbi:hypothetical protein QLX08_007326 [Tetragonisca angustula]|uniref:Uncharacterized protein n=1 Tax=Tetragonisca angustula TaxID=166442 RepID=A0AAW0ZRU0_9HYME